MQQTPPNPSEILTFKIIEEELILTSLTSLRAAFMCNFIMNRRNLIHLALFLVTNILYRFRVDI